MTGGIKIFFINIDISDLESLGNFKEAVEAAVKTEGEALAAMTHAKIVELASEKLHSRRQMYIDALSVTEEQGVHIISLDASVNWIEDGQPPHNMLDDLLSSPKAKRGTDGSRYLIVPFEHSKDADKIPASSQPMVDVVKQELKKRGIPFKKIQRDEMGRPIIGKIASFDVNHAPLKDKFGPGQGHGPIGDVRQGPNARQRVGGGPGGGGNPFLAGIQVTQREVEGKVKKSIMTYRIASSNMQGEEIWNHPGNTPVSLMDEAYEWCQEQFDKMVPQIIANVMGKL